MLKEITFAVKAPNWLGDAVMALPAVSGVVGCSRRGRVLVLGSEVSAGIFSRVDGTLPYVVTRPGGGALRSAVSIARGARVLRDLRPVMALSLTRSFTSAAMCYSGRVPRRIGFEDAAGSFLYTDRVRRPPRGSTHMIDMFNELVQSIGIPVDNRVPTLVPSGADLEAGKALMERNALEEGGYICLLPGARYGPAKMWPARRFALLADHIIGKFGRKVVLVGGRQERSACQAVEERMSEGAVINMCGMTDLGGLIGLVRFSGGVVSNDSGGMHLGAALGKPVVGLFFSTDPVWTGPVSENSVALYRPVDCSPCFERDCRKGKVCVDTIGEEEVIETLARVARLRA